MSNLPESLELSHEFEYENVLTENDVTVDKLPTELQDKITEIKKKYTYLKPTVGRFNKNPTEGLHNQFKKTLLEIERLDIEIAEEVVTFLEALNKPTPEPEPTPEPIIPEPMPTPEPIIAAEPAPTPEPNPIPAPEPTPTPSATIGSEEEKEVAILAKLDRDKRIKIKVLAEILGHAPANPIQKVGKISLRAIVFNSAEYRLV